MKTLKSIQKNQEQLNSLLMEKWGLTTESTSSELVTEELVSEYQGQAVLGRLPQEDVSNEATEEETLEEDHNCKTAHPGKNHEQWVDRYR